LLDQERFGVAIIVADIRNLWEGEMPEVEIAQDIGGYLSDLRAARGAARGLTGVYRERVEVDLARSERELQTALATGSFGLSETVLYGPILMAKAGMELVDGIDRALTVNHAEYQALNQRWLELKGRHRGVVLIARAIHPNY